MKGGLTLQELELRKRKAANLDRALLWMDGRIDSESLLTVRDILRDGLQERPTLSPEPTKTGTVLTP